jgi:hypothetical protein
MLALEKSSFFSRFTTKFVEVVGAGVATAVTGYLIAHMGGFLSAPEPKAVPAAATSATVQMPATVPAAPTATVVTKAQRTPASATAAKPNDKPNDQPVAATDESASPAAQPSRATATAPQATPSRKRGTTEAAAAESKPRERAAEVSPVEAKAETKPETKPEAKSREAERDMEAVEARVRAALANVDANRPAQPEPSHPSNPLPKATPVVVQPPPAETTETPTATVAAVPRATDLPPPVMLQPPAKSEPLTPVEIKSRPVADVDSMPAPTPASQQTAQEDRGLFSVFKKIPDMLRPAAASPPADPPRPPLPVGDSQ